MVSVATSSWRGNKATFGGGAIWQSGDASSVLLLNNQTFEDNSVWPAATTSATGAYSGRSLFTQQASLGSMGSMSPASVPFPPDQPITASHNTTGLLWHGGAVYAAGTGVILQMESVAMQRNRAMLMGGGLYFKDGNNLVISDSTLTENAAASGGAVSLHLGRGTATIYNTTFAHNTATFLVPPSFVAGDKSYQALLASTPGSVTANQSVLQSGLVPCGFGSGGGLCVASLFKRLLFQDNRLLNNTCQDSGAGLYVRSDLCVRLMRTRTQVEVILGGGGSDGQQVQSEVVDCMVDIVSNVIAGNRAGVAGSAIFWTDHTGVNLYCSNNTGNVTPTFGLVGLQDKPTCFNFLNDNLISPDAVLLALNSTNGPPLPSGGALVVDAAGVLLAATTRGPGQTAAQPNSNHSLSSWPTSLRLVGSNAATTININNDTTWAGSLNLGAGHTMLPVDAPPNTLVVVNEAPFDVILTLLDYYNEGVSWDLGDALGVQATSSDASISPAAWFKSGPLITLHGLTVSGERARLYTVDVKVQMAGWATNASASIPLYARECLIGEVETGRGGCKVGIAWQEPSMQLPLPTVVQSDHGCDDCLPGY